MLFLCILIAYDACRQDEWNASNNSRAAMKGKGDAHPTIVCVGGVNLQDPDSQLPGRSVLQLQTSTEEWVTLTTLGTTTHHGAVAVRGRRLFVVGKYSLATITPGCYWSSIGLSRGKLVNVHNKPLLRDHTTTATPDANTMTSPLYPTSQ